MNKNIIIILGIICIIIINILNSNYNIGLVKQNENNTYELIDDDSSPRMAYLTKFQELTLYIEDNYKEVYDMLHEDTKVLFKDEIDFRDSFYDLIDGFNLMTFPIESVEHIESRDYDTYIYSLYNVYGKDAKFKAIHIIEYGVGNYKLKLIFD